MFMQSTNDEGMVTCPLCSHERRNQTAQYDDTPLARSAHDTKHVTGLQCECCCLSNPIALQDPETSDTCAVPMMHKQYATKKENIRRERGEKRGEREEAIARRENEEGGSASDQTIFTSEYDLKSSWQRVSVVSHTPFFL